MEKISRRIRSLEIVLSVRTTINGGTTLMVSRYGQNEREDRETSRFIYGECYIRLVRVIGTIIGNDEGISGMRATVTHNKY